jgi:hypothetical protein
VVLALLFLLLALPGQAHAYVDPSAGSLLLQLILGGLAGLMVALRLSWKRLTRPVRTRADSRPGRGARPGPVTFLPASFRDP